ncbi:MAG: hypothetical protein OCD02_13170 [Spirochaetaceae bacterium]
MIKLRIIKFIAISILLTTNSFIFSHGFQENFLPEVNGNVKVIKEYEKKEPLVELIYNENNLLSNIIYFNKKTNLYSYEDQFLSNTTLYNEILNNLKKIKLKTSYYVIYIIVENEKLIREDHYKIKDKKEIFNFSKYYEFDNDLKLLRSYYLENDQEYFVQQFVYNNEIDLKFPKLNLVNLTKLSDYDEFNYRIYISHIFKIGTNGKKEHVLFQNIASDNYCDREKLQNIDDHIRSLSINSYKFNSDGNIESYIIYNSDGSIMGEYDYSYFYDKNENWIKKEIIFNNEIYKSFTRQLVY